jgi:hypothetical protein
MEDKKGEILNQLAIISDLLEKANLVSTGTTINFFLERAEFNRIYNTVYSKSKLSTQPPKNTFNVKIGEITMIFNTSSV